MNINQLIIKYAAANLEIEGIHRICIPPHRKAENQTTLKGVCGFLFPIQGCARFEIQQKEYILEPGVILHAGSGMKLNKEVLGEESWEYILLHYKVIHEKEDELSFKNL
ncbi:MAG: hypothetical protein PWP24_851 [Clostridiales bacterium]|nr:hypothetical protein [Clostridiales bacterium]